MSVFPSTVVVSETNCQKGDELTDSEKETLEAFTVVTPVRQEALSSSLLLLELFVKGGGALFRSILSKMNTGVLIIVGFAVLCGANNRKRAALLRFFLMFTPCDRSYAAGAKDRRDLNLRTYRMLQYC